MEKESEARKFFRIKNWDKYQNYDHKRRGQGPPPWIKLSTAFFDDAGLADMPDSQRLAWVALLIEASKNGNVLRWCPGKVRQRYGLRRAPDLDLFLAQGFIEICDGKNPAQIRVDEKQTSPEAKPPAPSKPKRTPEVSHAPSWSREACDDWIGRFGKGSANGGKIGRMLKPLVDAHGWSAVRPVWAYYLRFAEADFTSPAAFKDKFGEWQSRYRKASPIKPDAGSLDAALRAAGADGRD